MRGSTLLAGLLLGLTCFALWVSLEASGDFSSSKCLKLNSMTLYMLRLLSRPALCFASQSKEDAIQPLVIQLKAQRKHSAREKLLKYTSPELPQESCQKVTAEFLQEDKDEDIKG